MKLETSIRTCEVILIEERIKGWDAFLLYRALLQSFKKIKFIVDKLTYVSYNHTNSC